MKPKLIIVLVVGLAAAVGITVAVIQLGADPTVGVTGAQTGEAQRVTERAAVHTLELSSDNTDLMFTGSSKLGAKDGYFTELRGEVGLDADGEPVAISATLDMASVSTDAPNLTKKLKEEAGFFLVEKFPTATFVATAITPLDQPDDKGNTHTVTGNFKLKALERSISFPAKVTVTDATFQLESEFSMKRLEWGVDYDGGAAFPEIRDNVLLNLLIDVDRQPASGAG